MNSILPSLLDRLMPESVESESESAHGRVSLHAYAASVARDLEALLNTRNVLLGHRRPCGILSFGLPDFSSMSLANADDRIRMTRAVERAVLDHEPRLANLSVALSERGPCNASLHFVIRGKLRMRDASESIGFRADYRSTSLRFSVSHDRRATS